MSIALIFIYKDLHSLWLWFPQNIYMTINAGKCLKRLFFITNFRKTKFLTSNNAFVSHVTKLQQKSKHVIYIELCFKGDFLSNESCLPEGLSVWCLWIRLFSTDIVSPILHFGHYFRVVFNWTIAFWSHFQCHYWN